VKNILRTAAIAAIAALALTACGAAPTTTPTAGSTTGGATTGAATPSATPLNFKACIVSDQGGFDDKSFNQLSFEGVQKATKDLGAQFKYVQSHAPTDYQPNLTAMVGVGCNIIVSVGFALSADTVTSALANPKVSYGLVDDAADNNNDGKTDAPNIKPILFDTAQAAFLAGYLAAGYSKVGKVGTFGGQPYPTVTIFMDGFLQGVNYYNQQKGKTVKVVGWDGKNGLFTGGFSANDTAKGDAQQLLDQGVDVILPVGGPIYQSAIAAIQDSKKDVAIIGVDADQFVTDPSTDALILTSIQKKMDVATDDTVTAAAKGAFDPTPYVGTLANGGVDIAPLHNFESKVDPALAAEVKQLKQDIIDGKVKVKSYLAK
jgi:basic membrane protein A